jgi:peptidoglycan/xylan/chitin deacetylase (PgdA/CDA1 family)
VLRAELHESKLIIERITGRSVRAIAYPFGSFNAEVIAASREFYRFGITTTHGKHDTARHGDFEIRRMSVGRSTTMEEFRRMLAS